jgi:hypothetical protein
MSRFRTILCWLLCALLVGAGAPTARTSCNAGTAGGGGCCAVKVKCCCPDTAQAPCGCRTPKRDPAPPPQLPKQPLLCAAFEPMRGPATAVTPQPLACRVAQVDLPTGAVPHRSRQEALSVWRC